MKSNTLIAAATAAAFAFAGSALANDHTPDELHQDTVPPTEDTYTQPVEPVDPMMDDPMSTTGMPETDAPDTMAATAVTEDQLRGALEQVGYTEIDNVDIDAPMWSVEAVNPQGQHVLVQIDASTATIVAEQPIESEDAE